MGQLLSRQNSNEPLDIDGDEQYFDCLNLNDDSYEQEDKSHHYAVWIPPELEIPETEFIFDDMKSAFSLCKKYSKHNSRVRIFSRRLDAESFIEQSHNNSTFLDDSKTTNNDAEKLPYSDVPASELTKLYGIIERGDESEFQRLIWSNPRYLISAGDAPTIIKISVRYNSMHVAALSGQAGIMRLLINTIKNLEFIRRLYANDDEEQSLQRVQFLLDMYVNTPDKMQNETPLHLAAKFGHYRAVAFLLDEPICSRIAINRSGALARDIVCSRSNDKSKEKKILQLFDASVGQLLERNLVERKFDAHSSDVSLL